MPGRPSASRNAGMNVASRQQRSSGSALRPIPPGTTPPESQSYRAHIAASGYTADSATVRQKKTGRPVRFDVSDQTRQAVDDYLKVANTKHGAFLFTGRQCLEHCMITHQYTRLVSELIGSVALDPRLFGTHSLRRTKATFIYRRTGDLRAVQLLLGHTKIESTVSRYVPALHAIN
jgi:integrase